jgi:hypothetical protein
LKPHMTWRPWLPKYLCQVLLCRSRNSLFLALPQIVLTWYFFPMVVRIRQTMFIPCNGNSCCRIDVPEERKKFFEDATRLALDISGNQTFNTVKPLLNFWAAFSPSNEVQYHFYLPFLFFLVKRPCALLNPSWLIETNTAL